MNEKYPLLATPLDLASDIHSLFWSHFLFHSSITVLDNIVSLDQVSSFLPSSSASHSKSKSPSPSSSPGKLKNSNESNQNGSGSDIKEGSNNNTTTTLTLPPSPPEFTNTSIISVPPSSSSATLLPVNLAPSNSFSLPPLSHSGRVGSITRGLSKSSNLSAVINSSSSSSSSLKASGSVSSLPIRSRPSGHHGLSTSHSGGRKLIVIVSTSELLLQESNGVGVIKVKFFRFINIPLLIIFYFISFPFSFFFKVHLAPSKALVQLAVRQMAPLLKPEETLALVNLCNNNPKSLVALTRYVLLFLFFFVFFLFLSFFICGADER